MGMRPGKAKGPTVATSSGGGGSGIPIPTTAALGFLPYWFKFTVGHAALQAAALTNDIELFALPPGAVIHGVKMKHSIAFAGTGITGYHLSVGLVADLERYSSLFDVLSAPANTNLLSTSTFESPNQGGNTSIRLAAVSTGANLDQSTAGTVAVWLLLSTTP
jgi:hypothetical protein